MPNKGGKDSDRQIVSYATNWLKIICSNRWMIKNYSYGHQRSTLWQTHFYPELCWTRWGLCPHNKHESPAGGWPQVRAGTLSLDGGTISLSVLLPVGDMLVPIQEKAGTGRRMTWCFWFLVHHCQPRELWGTGSIGVWNRSIQINFNNDQR